MVDVALYKTYADYPNSTGVIRIAYALKDAVPLFNPFFAILLGFYAVITIASYYTYTTYSGKTRFFNSLTVAGFVTFIVSMFFALAGFISPYGVLFFIAVTTLSFALLIFYK